jgi:excisionase family DNA binding protein
MEQTPDQMRVVAEEPYLLRIKEAEERYRIPAATLYEMAARGVPGFVRMGRSVRIHRQQFERWLDAQAA